jgi:GT2 family glycosyltransferase
VKTEIILIKYNNEKVEKPCINSVIKHTKAPHHLTIYDNYPDNENIGKLWNRLISQSDAEYICLLNTDTLLTDNWLTDLLEAFDMFNDVGAVGPSTNNSKNHQSSIEPPLPSSVIDFRAAYPKECLSGFCLVFSRNIFKLVGGFPEDYGFYGQEVALLDKMTNLKYKQIWRKDVWVWHEGSATVKKEVKEGKFDELKERRKGREAFNKLRKKLGIKQV